MRTLTTPTTHRVVAAMATLALAGGLATAVTTPAAAATDDDLASRFTLAVLPDTQFYSRYDDQLQSRWGANPFNVQTQWLSEHGEELNIPFVTHLGDVVDRATVANEWGVADGAMRTLEEAQLPYSILAGNHDVRNSDERLDDTDYDLANEPFLTWFGAERAAAQTTFGGRDATGMSEYHVFEAEGQQFLVLALSWRISEATQQWAEDVIRAHPTLPVILTTHSLLAVESDQVSPLETPYGLELWESLIRENDQIFLTMNGHSHGATRLDKTNDYGHVVTEVLIDYQMAADGGNGYLGLYEFDLTNNEINVQTASPWVVAKPTDMLQEYDQPFLEGDTQQFTIDIDFAERFSGFTDSFGPGSADEPSLSQRARSILLDGFEGPDPSSTALPGNEIDYPEVPGTLAHWRFNGAGEDGDVLDGDTVIEDVAGENDMRRADPATSGASGAEWGDVTLETDDVPAFSADGAAACFANADRTTNRFSYFTTDADAPLNDADLTDGFTIETFVKMDAGWTADRNQWSKFLTRTGNRSRIPGATGDQWSINTSPMAFGISNLREFQFTSLPTNVSGGDRVNWSGEIMVDTWAHVAVVNDADEGVTTLYVDGAPVLRNATDAYGMAWNEGMAWILGADYADDRFSAGWNGCIGETRIVDRPTTSDEWLTERADISGLTVDVAPEGTLADDVASVTFAGTGFAGAEVSLVDTPLGSGSTVRSAALDGGATTVAADGTWEIVVDSGLTPGAHSVSISQALGARAAAPVLVSFAVAAPAVDPTDPTTEPTDPTTDPTSAPTDPSDGAAVTGDAEQAEAEGPLAATGYDASGMWLTVSAAGLVLIAGAVLLLIRARRRA